MKETYAVNLTFKVIKGVNRAILRKLAGVESAAAIFRKAVPLLRLLLLSCTGPTSILSRQCRMKAFHIR